jgi:hypothetical protein
VRLHQVIPGEILRTFDFFRISLGHHQFKLVVNVNTIFIHQLFAVQFFEMANIDAREYIGIHRGGFSFNLSLCQQLTLKNLSWRNCFDINGFNIRVFCLKIRDQLLHDHELVAGEVHHQVGRIGVFNSTVLNSAIRMKRPIVFTMSGIFCISRYLGCQTSKENHAKQLNEFFHDDELLSNYPED